jgi:hypothetical protein
MCVAGQPPGGFAGTGDALAAAKAALGYLARTEAASLPAGNWRAACGSWRPPSRCIRRHHHRRHCPDGHRTLHSHGPPATVA